MAYSIDLKALYILRQNVRALLMARKESEAALATVLGFKHRSSLNKFLNNERSGFQMSRLDRLAAFFGLPIYQLFQPGISALTERRRHGERRTGRERRQGHAHRVLSLRHDSDLYRNPGSPEASTYAGRTESPDEEIIRITREYNQRIATLLSLKTHAGEQAPAPRKRLPRPPKSGGTTRG